jgi:hypothetical protein
MVAAPSLAGRGRGPGTFPPERVRLRTQVSDRQWGELGASGLLVLVWTM